jgi:zinc protease
MRRGISVRCPARPALARAHGGAAAAATTPTYIAARLRFLAALLMIVSACIAALPDVAAALPPVERTVLPNGLILMICEDRSLPSVSVQLIVGAGSRRDPRGKGGLALLTAKSVLFGSKGLSFAAVQEELDFMGAELDSSAGEDYAVFGLRVLKNDLERGIEMLLRQITQPLFPKEEIERERQRVRAAIKAGEEEPMTVADREFRKILYGDCAYGHDIEGTDESVRRIGRRDIADFYRAFYHPNNSILVVVGDVTADEAKTILFPRISSWRPVVLPPEDFTGAYTEGPVERVITRKTTQASVILGQKGVSRENRDYYTLTVMNYILGGGGFGSRLVDVVRVKRGLAYSVDSAFIPRKLGGEFQVSLQTQNASAREAVGLVRGEIERIRIQPVSEEELQKAKRYLVGSFPMRLDSQAKLTVFLSQVEYYGLGLDYPERYPAIIEAITREDIRRVAREYLDPARLLLVVVGDVEPAP